MKMLRKQTWYPRPHADQLSWRMDVDGGEIATIVPIIMNDDGQGAPKSYKAHPENSSFTVYRGPNCYPESRINRLFARLRCSLTKHALETDKVPALRFGVMPIFTAFKKDLDAVDELTGAEVQDILGMQYETTDRQAYPLYDTTKLTEKQTGLATLHSHVPGLTTTQVLETVTFDIDDYYDALQYYTISDKLKAVQGGLKFFTLTRQHPTMEFDIKLRSKVKRMNPYTFLGILVTIPTGHRQITTLTETTGTDNHLEFNLDYSYHEWNADFSFEKVS
jgi:hypothetical protein